jgi:hypothetical protein
MDFGQFSEKTAIISLNSINQLIVVKGTGCGFSEVGIELLNSKYLG